MTGVDSKDPYRTDPVATSGEAQISRRSIVSGVGRKPVESRVASGALALSCAFGSLIALLLTVELFLALATQQRSVLLEDSAWTLTGFALIGGLLFFGLLAIGITAVKRRRDRVR